MKKLISDRRLYLTEDGDEVCEEGDPRARFLLVGAGGTISAAEVERLELGTKKGRVRYDGGPSVADLEKPKRGEGRASKVAEEEKVLVFGGDKTGGAPPIDPAPDGGEESEEVDSESAEASVANGETPGEDEAAGADVVADDSDRNDGELEAWPGRRSPEAYLKQYPTGPKAELAQRHIDAGADGAS